MLGALNGRAAWFQTEGCCCPASSRARRARPLECSTEYFRGPLGEEPLRLQSDIGVSHKLWIARA